MIKKAAYIISLKFAPGLMNLFCILGENMRARGINVKYFLSRRYAELGNSCDGMEYVTVSDGLGSMILDTLRPSKVRNIMQVFSRHQPNFLCFYNPHPLNPFIARLVKRKVSDTVTALYLHEPYTTDKSPYGMRKAVYITLAEFVQRCTLEFIDYVILPSEYSLDLFRIHYPDYKGMVRVAPLIMPNKRVFKYNRRRFFSLVGTANQATGHDTFVELINYVAARGLDYEFAIISSSDISKYYEKLSERARNIVKLVIRNIITASEINELIRESYAVFRLNKEAAQSAVIPDSFMNETPVIVRDIPGLRQHVNHKYDGYIVSSDCKSEELCMAMDFIKDNFLELSRNARNSYEKTWSECNWDRYYGWLTEILTNDAKQSQID
jgi:glycosyltransferase involved in cell wall biosynthesis